MTRSCDEFRRLRAREHELRAREFAELDRHVEGCPACSAHHRREDPLALFRAVAERPREPESWAGLWKGVRTAVEEAGRLGTPLLRPAYSAALAALLILGAGLLAIGMLDLQAPPAPPVTATAEPFGADVPAATAPLPTVESIRSPGARIVDLSLIGEGERVTKLVLIVDEEINL